MSILKQISSSIKTKKMSLEEKICYLESLQKQGIKIDTLPISYVSKDGIIINNMLINIRKYYAKDRMTVKQIIRCENLGIELQTQEVDSNFKINFLKKAVNEDYVLEQILADFGEYKNNSIYRYIEELRNSYEKDELDSSQVDECVNNLKIIIPKEERKELLLSIIRESALKNIVNHKQISLTLM